MKMSITDTSNLKLPAITLYLIFSPIFEYSLLLFSKHIFCHCQVTLEIIHVQMICLSDTCDTDMESLFSIWFRTGLWSLLCHNFSEYCSS